MKISEVINHLETIAPPVLQESYDNTGLLTGTGEWQCTGIIIALDATLEVINEAISKGCNMVVAHHPIIFSGIKKLNGKNYVERSIINAIKNDIAIYAIHTNLDNILTGVNARIADKLGLIHRQILVPKQAVLRKLFVFVPTTHAESLRNALFEAGGGHISNYSECSFSSPGKGTFKAGENAHPFAGKMGERHSEDEIKLEIIFPYWLQANLLKAMIKMHPYEEVAYDIISLQNAHETTGSGLIGLLPEPMEEHAFLQFLKQAFNLQIIKHTLLLNKMVTRVAVCGGAGSFLVKEAFNMAADIYETSDMKYHEFFDANSQMVIADIGHFESEQFTIDLLYDILHEKFPTFAVQKTGIKTNPVHYFL